MFLCTLFITEYLLNKDKSFARVSFQGKKIIHFCILQKRAFARHIHLAQLCKRGLKDTEHKPLRLITEVRCYPCQNEIRSSDPHTCENTDRSLCMCTHAAKLPFNQLECS